MTPDQRQRVIILRDCMSPVAGFEQAAEQFFAEAAAQGARIMNHGEALAQLVSRR
jgi:nicotinamidase/pyrazinamidase